MGRHRTAEEKVWLGEQARALRQAGRTRREIVRELGIGDDLAGRLLRGVPVPDALRRPRAKDELREVARALRSAGRAYRDIAEELGVSTSTCSAWLRDAPAAAGVVSAVPSLPAGPERDAARRRREEGALLREIAAEQGVSIRTAWTWCSGLPGPEQTGGLDHARRSRARWDAVLAQRDQERQEVRQSAAACVGQVSSRELVLALAVSYWCEGTKSKPWRRRERVVWLNSDPGLVRLFLSGLRELRVPDEQRVFRLQIHECADEPAARAWWARVVGVPAEQFARSTLKRHDPRPGRRGTGADYHGCLSISVRQSRTLYQHIDGLVLGLLTAADARDQAARVAR